MALTLSAKIVSFSLGNAVSARLEAFRKARADAQSSEELVFYQETAKGMTYEQQKAFRQGQLQREQNRDVPDNEYIAGLKKEVSGLAKLVANQRLKNIYLDSFTKLRTGMETSQEHLDILNAELAKTNDPDAQDLINGYISNAKTDQYKLEQQISDNYYTWAENDKTIPVLEKALNDVKVEKSKALGNGDAGRASALSLKEQALQTQVNNTKVDNSIHEFNLKKLKTYNPNDILDLFSQKLSDSSVNTPITYNNQTYSNEKEFWMTQESDYFNSGQFSTALNKYYGDVAQQLYNESSVTFPAKLKLVNDNLTSLLNRPNLTDFKPIIAGAVSGFMAKVSDMAAKSILAEADTNYNYQSAADKLSQLTKDTGVDQTENYFALVSKVAQVNQQAASSILASANQYKNDGLSGQQALSQAISDFQQGKENIVSSPEQIAKTDPTSIAKETVQGTASGKQPSNPTISNPPASFQNFQEGDLIKDPSSQQVYQVSGGKLKALGGSGVADEAGLKAATGKTYADIKQVTLANVNMPKGEDLIVNKPPEAPKIYRTKVGQRFGSFAPETEFALEGNVVRPFSSLQAKQKIAPNTQAQEVDTTFFNDKKLGENY